MQSIPYLAATEAVIEPEAEQRDESTIYLDLAKASGVNLFGSSIIQKLFELLKNAHGLLNLATAASVPQRLILSLMLRLSGHGSFKNMLRHPNGKHRQGAKANDFLGQRVVTSDAKVQLAPAQFISQAAGFDALLEQEITDKDSLRLITKRAHSTHNSWTQNIAELTHGPAGRSNYLYMHPKDAQSRGLHNGDIADVRTATATVRLPVICLADLMPGTVALPHGWGHQQASRLSIASKISGVNVNLLAADGPQNVDPLSGMSHLTGIAVEVELARGALDSNSWSGISSKSDVVLDGELSANHEEESLLDQCKV